MGIRVVTVDLWNTLVGAAGSNRRQADRLRRIQAYAARIGVELSEGAVLQALQETWRYYRSLWRGQQRTPTSEELTAFLWRVLTLPEEPRMVQQLAEELAYGVLESPPPLLPQAQETVAVLAEHYRLGLISDTAFSPGRVLRELLGRYGLADFFAVYSFSDETGVAKPHPRAYTTVLEALQARPEEALHIGDLEATDIQGAKQLGMYAVLFLGDPESEFPPPAQTSADAVAHHWQHIPRLIECVQGTDRDNARARPSA